MHFKLYCFITGAWRVLRSTQSGNYTIFSTTWTRV